MRHRTAVRSAVALALSGALAACTSAGGRAGDSAAATSSAAAGAGASTSATATGPASHAATTGATGAAAGDTAWRPLLDASMSQWRGYKAPAAPTGWTAAAGTLSKTGSVEDLVSKEQYGDFELAFDWQLDKGGNAGIFYRGTEEYEKIYWSGPEYQLLDDANHADGRSALTSAGAAYSLYAPPRGVTKPAGQWNSSRILVRGNHVEHWLNGQQVVTYELKSPDWEAKVKASKFKDWPNYGRASRGHIGIQGDHDERLQLRDMRIRTLS
jgi:hypothetical protein